MAKSAREDGLYQIAQKQFISFIKNFPENDKIPEAFFHLAECMLNLGKFEKARDAYAKAAECPGLAEASLYRTGCAFQLEGKTEESGKHFRNYIDNFPSGKFKHEALYRLGESLLESGMEREAGEAFLKAAGSGPAAPLHGKSLFAAGTVFLRCGEFEMAEDAFSRLIESGPGEVSCPDILYRSGISRMKTAGGEEAEKFFKRVFKEFPGSEAAPEALFITAIINFRRGDYPAAAELLEAFIENDKPPPCLHAAWLKLALAFEYLGRPEKAVSAYKNASSPDAAPGIQKKALFRLGRLKIETGETGRASEVFRRLEEAFPESIEANSGALMLSAAYYNKGAYNKAAQAAGEGGLRESFVQELCFVRAASLFMLEEYEAAGELFSALGSLGPGGHRTADCRFYAAVSLLKNGEPEAAIEKFEEFINTFKENSLLPHANFAAGEASSMLGNYRGAAVFFGRAAVGGENELSGKAFIRKGDALKASGSLEEASDAYGKARDTLPGAARLKEAETLYLMGRFPESAEAAADAEPFCGQSARHRKYLLAAALAKSENLPEAEKAFSGFIEQFPDSRHLPAALFSLGAVLYRQDRFEDALKFFQKTMDLFPGDHEAREAKLLAGVCLLESGRTEEALKIFEEYADDPEALKLEEALIRLGRIYFENGQHEKARGILAPLAQAGDKKTGPDAAFLLGRILKNQKDFSGAMKMFEKALHLEDNDVKIIEILLRLAETLRHQKEYGRALETYMRIRLAAPGPGIAREAKYHSAGILRNLGRYEDAIETYGKIERPLPEEIEADIQFRKAGCLREMGEYEEALLEYLKTAYLFPLQEGTALDALESAGEILIMLERPAEATKIYLKITELDPDGIKGEVASQKLKTLHE